MMIPLGKRSTAHGGSNPVIFLGTAFTEKKIPVKEHDCRIHAAMRRGELTSRQMVEMHCNRIDL
jgi:hypothetical protein